MQTVLLYLLIMGLVVAVIFAVVWFVFGRGEDLPGLEPATTLTRLPANGADGSDVRALAFAQVLRGYKPAEVDWALDRLATEIDDLRAQLARLEYQSDHDAEQMRQMDAGERESPDATAPARADSTETPPDARIWPHS